MLHLLLLAQSCLLVTPALHLNVRGATIFKLEMASLPFRLQVLAAPWCLQIIFPPARTNTVWVDECFDRDANALTVPSWLNIALQVLANGIVITSSASNHTATNLTCSSPRLH